MSTGSATRLVYVIGLVKWVALGLIALAVSVSIGASTRLAGSLDEPAIGTFGAFGLLIGAVVGLLVYIVFSWLQQTLMMLRDRQEHGHEGLRRPQPSLTVAGRRLRFWRKQAAHVRRWRVMVPLGW